MDRAGAKPGFDLSGDALCLDFVNTLPDRPRASDERLASWRDLVRWAGEAGAAPRAELRQLARQAARHPARAEAVHRRAIALRECLFRVFSTVADGRAAPAADLALLNASLDEALKHLRVEARRGGYDWTWASDGSSLARVLWPVVRSAADLLVSPERQHLRECQSPDCSWLFVDRSRTKRRRWCSMQTCGNRAKARRFHERRRRSSS
jgi:predicted RNA-binding Zn ribbon-like protein